MKQKVVCWVFLIFTQEAFVHHGPNPKFSADLLWGSYSKLFSMQKIPLFLTRLSYLHHSCAPLSFGILIEIPPFFSAPSLVAVLQNWVPTFPFPWLPCIHYLSVLCSGYSKKGGKRIIYSWVTISPILWELFPPISHYETRSFNDIPSFSHCLPQARSMLIPCLTWAPHPPCCFLELPYYNPFPKSFLFLSELTFPTLVQLSHKKNQIELPCGLVDPGMWIRFCKINMRSRWNDKILSTSVFGQIIICSSWECLVIWSNSMVGRG